MAKLVIASKNKGKVKEIHALLKDLAIEVVSLEDFPNAPNVLEDGHTFAENALKKARLIREFTGLTTLADDSGLEVDFLQGAPGVRSARFAGECASDADNNKKLLELMEDVPESQRTARFKCLIAVVGKNGQTEILDGSCEGTILTEARGSGGFGYDPLFYVPELGKTFAEMTAEDKTKLSHRGKALRAVLPIVARWQQQGQI
ncbi:MAG: XTP/dITP diphosphatase [Firmicutes bacterium]|nr:XTP/dITP diphosphatase [Bacillota bacterium]